MALCRRDYYERIIIIEVMEGDGRPVKENFCFDTAARSTCVRVIGQSHDIPKVKLQVYELDNENLKR